jgi:hypothetical protein
MEMAVLAKKLAEFNTQDCNVSLFVCMAKEGIHEWSALV